MKRNLKIILSIDGGGIRGMLPLVYLIEIQRLLSTHHKRWTYPSLVDLFAGTSTGAVIGSALTFSNDGKKALFSPEALLELYKDRGKQVFDKERSKKHNEYPLKKLLEQSFGDIRLSDFSKYFLFVSHDQKSDTPFIFTNDDKKYRNVNLSKALLACSAIKDYFPAVELGPYELIDGIETAKNPAQIAYEYGKKYFPNDLILLMSFGTGEIDEEKQDEIDREAEHVNDMLIEEAKNNKKLIYHRFQPKIHFANYDMDNTSQENLINLYKDASIALEKDAQPMRNMVRFIVENR
jgi:patatin-like phospholipase/acyl hydrolase